MWSQQYRGLRMRCVRSVEVREMVLRWMHVSDLRGHTFPD